MTIYVVKWADTGKALVEAETASEALDVAEAHPALYDRWLSAHTAAPATEAERHTLKPLSEIKL